MQGVRPDGTVLVVTDTLDENVFLASRNLPDVLVLEAREVDPVSLVRFHNVLLTKAPSASSRRCWDERTRTRRPQRRRRPIANERLMTVLLAPVVSEKATFIADKHEQVVFRVAAGRDQARDQGRGRAACSRSRSRASRSRTSSGKEKRFGRFIGRRRHWKKAYVCLKPGQEINFAQEA